MSNLENYMKQQAIFCEQNDSISKNLYSEYGVKRGLRDEKGHQSAGSEVPSDSFPPGEAKWCKPLACTLYYRACARRFLSGKEPGGSGNQRIGMGFAASLSGGTAAYTIISILYFFSQQSICSI